MPVKTRPKTERNRQITCHHLLSFPRFEGSLGGILNPRSDSTNHFREVPGSHVSKSVALQQRASEKEERLQDGGLCKWGSPNHPTLVVLNIERVIYRLVFGGFGETYIMYPKAGNSHVVVAKLFGDFMHDKNCQSFCYKLQVEGSSFSPTMMSRTRVQDAQPTITW